MSEEKACFEKIVALLVKNELKPVEVFVSNVDGTFPNGVRSREETEIPYKVKTVQEIEQIPWGKSLSVLPPITIKEIEYHRLCSGKSPDTAIIKTLDRGRRFKDERYLTSDSIFTRWDDEIFVVKARCMASMKKGSRDVVVVLDRSSAIVSEAKYMCPAGNSGYCNHVMALLLELAD